MNKITVSTINYYPVIRGMNRGQTGDPEFSTR